MAEFRTDTDMFLETVRLGTNSGILLVKSPVIVSDEKPIAVRLNRMMANPKVGARLERIAVEVSPSLLNVFQDDLSGCFAKTFCKRFVDRIEIDLKAEIAEDLHTDLVDNGMSIEHGLLVAALKTKVYGAFFDGWARFGRIEKEGCADAECLIWEHCGINTISKGGM